MQVSAAAFPLINDHFLALVDEQSGFPLWHGLRVVAGEATVLRLTLFGKTRDGKSFARCWPQGARPRHLTPRPGRLPPPPNPERPITRGGGSRKPSDGSSAAWPWNTSRACPGRPLNKTSAQKSSATTSMPLPSMPPVNRSMPTSAHLTSSTGAMLSTISPPSSTNSSRTSSSSGNHRAGSTGRASARPRHR